MSERAENELPGTRRPGALASLSESLSILMPENSGPESGRAVVFFVFSSQGAPFPIDQKPGESHRQLGKQVVIGDGESEMDAMPKSWVG